MTDKQKNIIVAIAIFIILGLFFGFGYWTYSKVNPITIPDSDTIIIKDTIEYHITDNHYLTKIDSIKFRDNIWMDSVIKANKVDTSALLADYYALHYYNKGWQDTSLTVTLKYMVTENKPIIPLDFSYKILRPQTIINNSTVNNSYSRYLYAGLDVPIKDIKYTNIDLIFAFRKGYGGIGYNPNLGSITLKSGITIVKLK